MCVGEWGGQSSGRERGQFSTGIGGGSDAVLGKIRQKHRASTIYSYSSFYGQRANLMFSCISYYGVFWITLKLSPFGLGILISFSAHCLILTQQNLRLIPLFTSAEPVKIRSSSGWKSAITIPLHKSPMWL